MQVFSVTGPTGWNHKFRAGRLDSKQYTKPPCTGGNAGGGGGGCDSQGGIRPPPKIVLALLNEGMNVSKRLQALEASRSSTTAVVPVIVKKTMTQCDIVTHINIQLMRVIPRVLELAYTIAFLFEDTVIAKYLADSLVLQAFPKETILKNMLSRPGSNLYLVNIGIPSMLFLDMSDSFTKDTLKPLFPELNVYTNNTWLDHNLIAGCNPPNNNTTSFSLFFNATSINVLREGFETNADAVMAALVRKLDFVQEVKALIVSHKLVIVLDEMAKIDKDYVTLQQNVLSGSLTHDPEAILHVQKLEQKLLELRSILHKSPLC